MNFNKEYYNVLYLLFAILVRIAAGSCRERLTLIYLVAPYNLPFTILPHILREFRDSVQSAGCS